MQTWPLYLTLDTNLTWCEHHISNFCGPLLQEMQNSYLSESMAKSWVAPTWVYSKIRYAVFHLLSLVWTMKERKLCFSSLALHGGQKLSMNGSFRPFHLWVPVAIRLQRASLLVPWLVGLQVPSKVHPIYSALSWRWPNNHSSCHSY